MAEKKRSMSCRVVSCRVVPPVPVPVCRSHFDHSAASKKAGQGHYNILPGYVHPILFSPGFVRIVSQAQKASTVVYGGRTRGLQRTRTYVSKRVHKVPSRRQAFALLPSLVPKSGRADSSTKSHRDFRARAADRPDEWPEERGPGPGPGRSSPIPCRYPCHRVQVPTIGIRSLEPPNIHLLDLYSSHRQVRLAGVT